MLNPRHLTSLLAIAEHGGFAAAGAAVGRSHSAISLHIKALEQEVGVELVDRSVRPPALTSDGEALAEQARRLQSVLDDIAALTPGANLTGRLSLGIVPTAMSHLAPPALARLRHTHPDLRLDIRTGLSGELADMVRTAELDAALVTAPDLPPEGLEVRTVAEEPLVVIAPPGADGDDAALVTAHPFIWFSRKTWAGQQIERRLLDRGLRVRPAMEVDSLEAIEALVHHGLGASIVPDRGGTEGVGGELVRVPFGNPQVMRRLVLMTRPRPPRARLIAALMAALTVDSGNDLAVGGQQGVTQDGRHDRRHPCRHPC